MEELGNSILPLTMDNCPKDPTNLLSSTSRSVGIGTSSRFHLLAVSLSENRFPLFRDMRQWSSPPIEGAFTERDVNEVADNSESAERSKYEPFHHIPRYNVCLQALTILVRHPPFVSGFRLSPALLGTHNKSPRQDRGPVVRTLMGLTKCFETLTRASPRTIISMYGSHIPAPHQNPSKRLRTVRLVVSLLLY